MPLYELIKELSESSGVAGFEGEVFDVVKRHLNGFVDELYSDGFGNLIAVKGKGKYKLLVAAHVDEIGLIVKHIDDNGFIRFAKLGGVPDHVLLGQRVKVHGVKGVVRGVIGCKAIHVMKEDERKQLVTYDKMFIDVGARSKREVEDLGVKLGSPITIEKELVMLGNGLVCGKSLDDRAGVAVLIEALKRASPRHKVYAVFTVQEEVGLRGATVVAYSVKPDVGLAIDTTIAGDHPEMAVHEAPVKVGFGPVILVADGRRDGLGGGLIAHPKVRQWLVNLAEDINIPYQLEVVEGGTTDAAAIQLSRQGVPAGVVSLPARYLHSFSEVVSLADAENLVKLLVKAFESDLPI